LDRDADQFPLFEVVVKKRGRGWRWRVCTSAGVVVIQGFESIRAAAKYKADRAVFQLLLSASYRSVRLSNTDVASSSAGIRAEELTVVPLEFALSLDNFRTVRMCRLIWRHDDFLGVAFES
jgi:hypothetical protein